jgi:hypothetical protein
MSRAQLDLAELALVKGCHSDTQFAFQFTALFQIDVYVDPETVAKESPYCLI